MEPTLVDLAALNTPEARAYFLQSDRRLLTGLRAVCDILNIPHPDYARHRKPGPRPAGWIDNYRLDHPDRRTSTLAPRKPNASPEAVAAARARSPLHAGLAR